MLELSYSKIADWPPSAWIIRLRPDSRVADVWCGSRVECTERWFCEAVWDGDFGAGDFDRTDIVAGSGGRSRTEGLTLVSSGSTVDRLQYLVVDGATWVSNSLVCLMAQCDATPDLGYPHYFRDFNSIVAGIDRHVSRIATDRGEVTLVYFRNLLWNGVELTVCDKPQANRRLDSFEHYAGFLRDSMGAVMANLADDARDHPYTPLGTLSTGYDSTTVTALGEPFGLNEVICFEQANKRDLGAEIAHHFNVQPIPIEVSAWRALSYPEVPFLAADAIGEEVHFSAATAELFGRVLFTGYHGDKVWDRDSPYLYPDLRRGDVSGLSLTEFRLWAGFINCPVPFWGARQLADINRISRSPEMSAWDVGGDYTRPICRRIVESAGVPRCAFGVIKSQASRWFVNEDHNLTPDSRADCIDFVQKNPTRLWHRLGLSPASIQRIDDAVMRAIFVVSGWVTRVPGLFRTGMHQWPVLGRLVAIRVPNPPHPALFLGLRTSYFPWAMEKAKQRYERVVR